MYMHVIYTLVSYFSLYKMFEHYKRVEYVYYIYHILSYPWDNKFTPSGLASMFRSRHCRTRRRDLGPGH